MFQLLLSETLYVFFFGGGGKWGQWEGMEWDWRLGSWALGPGPLGHVMSGKLAGMLKPWPWTANSLPGKTVASWQSGAAITPITHEWPGFHLSCPSGSFKMFLVHPAWASVTGITTRPVSAEGLNQADPWEKQDRLALSPFRPFLLACGESYLQSSVMQP